MRNAAAVGLEQIRAFPLTRRLRGHHDFRRVTWGLNSAGTLQGFRHFSGKPTTRPSVVGFVSSAALQGIYPVFPVTGGIGQHPRRGNSTPPRVTDLWVGPRLNRLNL